jgi:hypothetical protein
MNLFKLFVILVEVFLLLLLPHPLRPRPKALRIIIY